MDPLKRCPWAEGSPEERAYHDREWGVPLYDDQKLFEFLILEGFQAGLSWRLILRKREAFHRAFAEFNARRIARYGEAEVDTLLEDEGIVRNRLKIEAAIINAQAYLDVLQEWGRFGRYLWTFVGGAPRVNGWSLLEEIPASTTESQAMSRALRSRGFKFVGPTICYAFMQAIGMVNDHLVSCFRYREVRELAKEPPFSRDERSE